MASGAMRTNRGRSPCMACLLRTAGKFGACALEGRRRVVVCSLDIGRSTVCTWTPDNPPKAPSLLAFSRSREVLSETDDNLGTPSAIPLTTAISGASVQAGWGTPLLHPAGAPLEAAAAATGLGVLVQAGRVSPPFMPAAIFPRWPATRFGAPDQAGRESPAFIRAAP